MSATEAVRLAQENGIRLRVSGNDLILEADREPAATVLDALKCHKTEVVTIVASGRYTWGAEDWQAFFDERAGIAEFDGGQSRADAEAIAFECCIIEWLNRHPDRSDPDRCAWCGQPDHNEHAIVPFCTGNLGCTWLHPECWHDWHAMRKADAVAALLAMGIIQPTNFPNDFGKNGGE